MDFQKIKKMWEFTWPTGSEGCLLFIVFVITRIKNITL